MDRSHVQLPAVVRTDRRRRSAFEEEPLIGNWGIWVGKPRALELFVRDGDVVPGTDGATFRPSPTGDVPLINANDVVAFTAFFAPENDLGL